MPDSLSRCDACGTSYDPRLGHDAKLTTCDGANS